MAARPTFADFAHGVAAVEGGRLHYRRGGSGAPVILLHGWPQDSLQWHTVAPLLATHYDVVVPDLPGCGGSDIRRDGRYDKRTIATALKDLTNQLSIANVRLAGYDHGAGVAYNYACLDREGVSHLAILEFVLQGCGYEDALAPRPDWNTASNWQLGLFTVPDVAEFAFRGRERELLTWFFWHAAHNPSAVSQDHLQHYVDQISRPGALRAGIGYYATLWQDIGINKENMRGKLTMPVLGIGGRHNMGEAVGESLRAVATDPEGAVIAGAGHWLSDEQPEVLAERLLDFFRA